jgi:hypothetical protein
MRTENLSLKEQFMLLALEDNEGSLIHDSIPFQVGLAGAVIYEMVKNGVFNLHEHHLTLNQQYQVDADDCYEIVINQYKKHKQAPLIKTMIEEIWSDADQMRKLIIMTLVNKGILTVEKKKILWFFTVKRYPTINRHPELLLRARLKDLITQSLSPSDEEFVLLKLIAQCDLVQEVFGENFVSKVSEYINKIQTANEAAAEISQSVTELEKSLFDAITASTLSVVISGN